MSSWATSTEPSQRCYLAQWYAGLDEPHERREKAADVLSRALEISDQADNEEARAQALLQLGRVLDTLGPARRGPAAA